MSELLPSLTTTIVCSILGVGIAWGFYKLIYNREWRYWAFVPLIFVGLPLADLRLNSDVSIVKILSIFLITLFIGLASTPIDD